MPNVAGFVAVAVNIGGAVQLRRHPGVKQEMGDFMHPCRALFGDGVRRVDESRAGGIAVDRGDILAALAAGRVKRFGAKSERGGDSLPRRRVAGRSFYAL